MGFVEIHEYLRVEKDWVWLRFGLNTGYICSEFNLEPSRIRDFIFAQVGTWALNLMDGIWRKFELEASLNNSISGQEVILSR